MTDLERLEDEFGASLAAALRGYAAEADTSIDASEVARLTAQRYPRRSWLGSQAAALALGARAVAALLVMVALLLLILAALPVGQDLLRSSVHPSPVRGHVECLETAPGTRSVEGATVVVTGIGLSCRLETEVDRTSGALSMVITRTLVDGRNGTQLGTATLTTSAGTWTGAVLGLFVEDGPYSLHMFLGGSGSFRDQRLRLVLVSPDGGSWGADGTIGPRP